MNKLELEYLNPETLIMDDMNPRTHPESMLRKLAESVEHYGFIDPILITKDRKVVAGHGRLKIALKKGLKTVPTITLPLTDIQATAYGIFDNKISENSRWQMKLLNDIINDMTMELYDVRQTGFDDVELREIIRIDNPDMHKSENPELELDPDLLDDDDDNDNYLDKLEQELEDEEKQMKRQDVKVKKKLDGYKFLIKQYSVNENGKSKLEKKTELGMYREEYDNFISELEKYNPNMSEEGNKGFINHFIKNYCKIV